MDHLNKMKLDLIWFDQQLQLMYSLNTVMDNLIKIHKTQNLM